MEQNKGITSLLEKLLCKITSMSLRCM